MRAIAVAALFGIACWGQTQVKLTDLKIQKQGACDVSLVASFTPREPVIVSEGESPAKLSLADKEVEAYFDAAHATYTTDSVTNTVTFQFKAKRHKTKSIDGDVQLSAGSTSLLKDLPFSVSLKDAKNRIDPAKDCPAMMAPSKAVKLTSNTHFWLTALHPNVWQVTGVVEAEKGSGGEVTVRGDDWSHNLVLGDKPVLVSETFYAAKRIERFEILEAATQRSLTAVTPQLPDAVNPGPAVVEWIALGLASIAAIVAALLWLWVRKSSEAVTGVRNEINQIRRDRTTQSPGTPATFMLTAPVAAKIREEFDARYITANQLSTALKEPASDLKKLKDALGDFEKLPAYSTSSIPEAPATNVPAADRFCAAINEWLANKSRPSKESLLEQLRAVGLKDCRLVSLEGVDETRAEGFGTREEDAVPIPSTM